MSEINETQRNEMLNLSYTVADKIKEEASKAVNGKGREITLLICALFSGSHVLIEDIPGVGKTTLAMAVSRAAGLSFKRAQFTPDVMASDITGFNIYNRKTEAFEFRQGLINTNIFLADEINRASPKTQSSLLEAMEEMSVTVDGVTYYMPKPFAVIATQNPSGFVGTFPLPEAQLDRFAIKISMGYPVRDDELNIMRSRKASNPMDDVKKVADDKIILACIKAAEQVYICPEAEQYIVDLVRATREHPLLAMGASPRASLSLMKLSRALALIRHRDHVRPEDISDLYTCTLCHRIVLNREARSQGAKEEDVLEQILKSVKIPFIHTGIKK